MERNISSPPLRFFSHLSSSPPITGITTTLEEEEEEEALPFPISSRAVLTYKDVEEEEDSVLQFREVGGGERFLLLPAGWFAGCVKRRRE